MLTPGELVIPKNMVQHFAQGGMVQYMQDGGAVKAGSATLVLDSASKASFDALTDALDKGVVLDSASQLALTSFASAAEGLSGLVIGQALTDALNEFSDNAAPLVDATTGLDTAAINLSNIIESLGGTLAGMESGAQSITDATSAVNATLNNVSGQITNLNGVVQQLGAALTPVSEAVSGLNPVLNTLAGHINTLSTNLSAFGGYTQAFSDGVINFGGYVDTFTGSFAEFGNYIQTFQQEISAFATAIATFPEQLTINANYTVAISGAEVFENIEEGIRSAVQSEATRIVKEEIDKYNRKLQDFGTEYA
jgi:ABC-type transporter Mla subunit MlaD